MSDLLFLGRDVDGFSDSVGKIESLKRTFDLIQIKIQRERTTSKMDELLFPSFCVWELPWGTMSGHWVLPAPWSGRLKPDLLQEDFISDGIHLQWTHGPHIVDKKGIIVR
jgi:hypothetical protein